MRKPKLIEALTALILIAAGVGLIVAGAGGQAPRQSEFHYLNHTESEYAELHQQLATYGTCVDSGRWDEWPCTQWPRP